MVKKLFIMSVIMFMVLAAAACSNATRNQVGNVVSSVAQLIKGDVTGELGKTYATQWFEFTVDYIAPVDEYAGYKPDDGNRLVDVFIKEKGTFDEPSPMGTFDFYLESSLFDDYIYPMDPIDDSMMPLEFMLEKGQTVEYHMIYEIPASVPDVRLMYTELDEDEKEGATFTIPYVL
ncbi:MAG: hypothetical protein LBR98_06280 [Syntrophomonadaceae bacterium]|jgi:hypothetical protein|nr:hypothetical protein [Syntrophomonadaceae bacterium]